MDFSKVKIVEKANPRKPETEVTKEAKPTFHIKVDYNKQKMVLSPVLFDQIQLEHNSLAQGIGPGNELLLIVCPGNSGVFAKSQEGSARKGRSYKNIKFVNDLITRGWKGGKFNLEPIGEHEGKSYYQVVPFGANTEATTEVKIESEPAVEEEVSFN